MGKDNNTGESFAAVLADLRMKARLSVAELAGRSGLTGQMIYYLEAGQRQPSLEVARRLARGLGVSLTVIDRRLPEPLTPARPRHPE